MSNLGKVEHIWAHQNRDTYSGDSETGETTIFYMIEKIKIGFF